MLRNALRHSQSLAGKTWGVFGAFRASSSSRSFRPRSQPSFFIRA